MKASEVVKKLHELMEQDAGGEGDAPVVIKHDGKFVEITAIIRRKYPARPDNELPPSGGTRPPIGTRPPTGGTEPPTGGTTPPEVEPPEGSIEIQT
jgi:hypothetical protein